MRLLADLTSGAAVFVAIVYAATAKEPQMVRQPSRADLKLQASVWSPVGVRTRWRAHQ